MTSSKPEALARILRDRVAALEVRNVPAVRSVRREFSREIAGQAADAVIRIALCILEEPNDTMRFVAYEVVSQHRGAFESLTPRHLTELGRGIDSWVAVDCFASYLSGPSWLHGRVSDSLIEEWAHHGDRWWRRAALVSTVALARRGAPADLARVNTICEMLVSDRDDMVVKALSWAIREVAKKHPEAATRFVAKHRSRLAARVIREVETKVRTGLKTPKR